MSTIVPILSIDVRSSGYSSIQVGSPNSNSTNWNWWKPVKSESQEREEMVDLLQLHFIVQVSIELGMRPKEILDEYLIKKSDKKGRTARKRLSIRNFGVRLSVVLQILHVWFF
jgi:hypothetical protein